MQHPPRFKPNSSWFLREWIVGLAALSLVAPSVHGATPPPSSESSLSLERLPYNHPGLVVDLGVGLWAWPIPCDADGDGDLDLIVSCPDKPSNGVYLFENTTGDTRVHKRPVFKAARRLSAATHYVMPSYVDGQLHVLTPGFEHPRFTQSGLSERQPIPVNANFYVPRGTQPKGPKVRHKQWRWTDYNGDGRQDLVVGIEDWSDYGWDDAWSSAGVWRNGPLHGFVHIFQAQPGGGFSSPSLLKVGDVPLETFGCPSPNFGDFDHDGDLDLLCGEFLDGFTYFENIGSRTHPAYTNGKRLKTEVGSDLRMDLQMIVPIAIDWDKDGDLDLVVGDEDGRVALIENLNRLTPDRTPLFKPPIYFQQEADTLKCGALATPVGVDWDGDGDVDIVSGNTAGYIEVFENLSGPKVPQPKWAAPTKVMFGNTPFRIMAGPNGSIQGPAEAKWGYTTINVADWDQDGRLDIVLNSIWGRVSWLRNVGSRTTPQFAELHPIQVEWQGKPPKPSWTWWNPAEGELVTQWRTTPVVHDFNQDGLPDLAMLDQEGYLAFFERAKINGRLILRAPRRAFLDEAGKPLRPNAKSAGGSGRRKWCVTDWDGDGRFDLLLNSSNADWFRQVEAKDDHWVFKHVGPLAQRNIEGHDVSPATVDFNGDGIPDFLGGAEDGRFYFMPNPRTQL